MSLSEDQIKIIADHPLDLGHVRAALQDATEAPSKKTVINLFYQLLRSQAAQRLSSVPSPLTVQDTLVISISKLLNDTQSLDQFTPLITAVTAAAPDTDVWATVLNLHDTNTVPQASLPPSISPTHGETLVENASDLLSDSETIRVDEEEDEDEDEEEEEGYYYLFPGIEDYTFRGVDGFWDKFFNPDVWQDGPKQMLDKVMAELDENSEWKDLPSELEENAMWCWLNDLQERCLPGAPNELYYTITTHDKLEGRMSVFFQPYDALPLSVIYYDRVYVLGRLKVSYDGEMFKADLLQLAGLVHEVFGAQPHRRFVHAFSLYAYTMELWVFDRSGPYSSGVFDIRKEPYKFARALVGYATLDRAALGFDMFVDHQRDHPQVTLDDPDSSPRNKEINVELGKKLHYSFGVVGRGTTCYETQPGHIAKFSWAPAQREREADLLKQARRKGVAGVVRIVGYREIATIAELRAGLRFPDPYCFQEEADHTVDRSSAVGGAEISDRKRNFYDPFISASHCKKEGLNSQQPKLTHELSGQLHDAVKQQWQNRISSCLVVSPAGRLIKDFSSAKELLEAMRDAIRAHLSLYELGQILHRDISPENIIITQPETSDGFKGMLIDLDQAKGRSSDTDGSPQRMGTIEFMAIEVLSNNADHTYRHDLESFFYVLLWMCAVQSWHKPQFKGDKIPPRVSCLYKWIRGDFRDMAKVKYFFVIRNRLRFILNEFPDSLNVVKPLCRRIRDILFLSEKGEVTFHTPQVHSELYHPIIEAYDEAIKSLP